MTRCYQQDQHAAAETQQLLDFRPSSTHQRHVWLKEPDRGTPGRGTAAGQFDAARRAVEWWRSTARSRAMNRASSTLLADCRPKVVVMALSGEGATIDSSADRVCIAPFSKPVDQAVAAGRGPSRPAEIVQERSKGMEKSHWRAYSLRAREVTPRRTAWSEARDGDGCAAGRPHRPEAGGGRRPQSASRNAPVRGRRAQPI